MRIDPQLVGQSRQLPLTCPILSPITRGKEGKHPFFPVACGNIKGIGIRRTAGLMEYRPSSPGPDDFEVTWAGVTTVSQQHPRNGKLKKEKDHLFLYLAFVPIVSLSFWQKVVALSIPLRTC